VDGEELEIFIRAMEEIGVGNWKEILNAYLDSLGRRNPALLCLKWKAIQGAVARHPPANGSGWRGGLNPNLARRVKTLMKGQLST
jgi:hypothetical protein